MSKGTVLVGGGTGFIGSHLCNLLRNRKYNVKIISRMPGPQRMTWHDLEQSGLPDGTTAVVNVAGQNVLDPSRRWTPGFKQNVWNSRVKTTTALAKAIEKAAKPPSVFVTISGVGIYEPSDTAEYSEDTADMHDFDFLSKLCIEWEKAANLPPTVDCRHIAIRSGVVLGRNGGMIKQLYLPFYLGLGGPVGSGSQYLPWIHVADTVRLITFAIETNDVKGIINGVAPQVITNKQFTEAFAKALWRPAVFPLPEMVLNVVFSEERAKMMTQGQKVLAKRAQALGFKFAYPDIHSACQDVVNASTEKSITYEI